MTWATLDDVVTVTGQEASEASLLLAHTIVDMIGGVEEEAGDNGLVSTTNLRHLQRAVAFQAVWLDAHPDVLQTMDVEGISQDGLNAQYAHRYAHLVAPLAMLAMNRLSWKRAPIRVGRGRRFRRDLGNRDSAVHDDERVWDPLPFGSRP